MQRRSFFVISRDGTIVLSFLASNAFTSTIEHQMILFAQLYTYFFTEAANNMSKKHEIKNCIKKMHFKNT